MTKRIPNNPVTIYRPRTLAQARVATVALEGAGIPTYTLNAETGSNLGHIGVPVAISVQVAQRHETAAKSLIAELEGRGSEPNPEHPAAITGTCDECGAEREVGFNICWRCTVPLRPR